MPNKEKFDCCICLTDYGPNEGIVLHNCMHTLCKGCFAQYVCKSEELIIRCPQTNNQGQHCEGRIEDREIKGVLNAAEFDLFIRRCVQMSEQQLPNSFHCRSVNCTGFGIVELNDHEFICSVCQNVNCLKCKVRTFSYILI